MLAAIADVVRRIPGRSVRQRHPSGRGLLVLDTAYSLDTMRRWGIEHSLTSRDLDGFFDRVWHVHPLVGANPDELSLHRWGLPTEEATAPGHTVIEGHPALRAASKFPMLEFALAQFMLFRRLHRILGSGQVDAVSVGDPYYLGLLGLGLAQAHGLPLVVRINGNYDLIHETVGLLAYPRLLRRRWVEKRIDQFVLTRTDLVVAANRNNLQFAIASGAKSERCAIFPISALIEPIHRVDPATRGDARNDLGLGDRPYLVTVSRLDPVKHSEDVLRVLARVRLRHPRVGAVVVGDGPQRADLQALAIELGIYDDLVLVGNRDQEWIARVLANSAVVVLPLAGRALVEAALCGRPIVAYDSDWHCEFINDGVTGYLATPGDVDMMADRVSALLDDPALANRMGQASRAAAMEVTDPVELVQHEQDTYAWLLSGHMAVGTTP